MTVESRGRRLHTADSPLNLSARVDAPTAARADSHKDTGDQTRRRPRRAAGGGERNRSGHKCRNRSNLRPAQPLLTVPGCSHPRNQCLCASPRSTINWKFNVQIQEFLGVIRARVFWIGAGFPRFPGHPRFPSCLAPTVLSLLRVSVSRSHSNRFERKLN